MGDMELNPVYANRPCNTVKSKTTKPSKTSRFLSILGFVVGLIIGTLGGILVGYFVICSPYSAGKAEGKCIFNIWNPMNFLRILNHIFLENFTDYWPLYVEYL